MDTLEQVDTKRTLKQNKAIHLYCSKVAQALSDSGLDMKKVLGQTVDIPWETASTKKWLWKPIQDAQLLKKSTTELNTNEVTKIYETLNRFLGEKFGVHVPFPSLEEQMYEANSIKRKK